MNGPEVIAFAQDALMTGILMASPLLLLCVIVGVAVSLFQALTQVQEMTLTYVPKIVAVFVAMLLVLPFMADALQSHMIRMVARITAGG